MEAEVYIVHWHPFNYSEWTPISMQSLLAAAAEDHFLNTETKIKNKIEVILQD